jgi:hemin uptake protein HemP
MLRADNATSCIVDPMDKMPVSNSDAELRTPPGAPDSPVEPVTIRSEELLRGATEVRIVHGSDIYRLRLTHNGRLILSK